VTFIETVCAVALLSLVVVTMLGSVGYLHSAQQRGRQRLACAELANRLILQYLDDKDTLPAPSAPLEYGSERFRWDLREEPVTMTPAVVDDSRSRTSNINRADRFLMVTVRVWLSEESGGSRELAVGTPTVSLWRFVDPTAFRNPDAINRMISTDAGRRRLLESMLGTAAPPTGGASTGSRATPTPTPTAPATPTPGRNAPISGGSR